MSKMIKLKIWLAIVVLSMSQMVYSQQGSLKLIRQEENKWTYLYQIGQYSTNEIKTEQGSFSQIVIPNHHLSSVVGYPQLPVQVNLIEIPICKEVTVEINRHTRTIQTLSQIGVNFPLAPAQPALAKDAQTLPLVIDSTIYSSDTFYSQPLVSAEQRGVMRSACLAALSVSPISYNPVSGELIVTQEIEFSLVFVQPDYAATSRLKNIHSNNLFANMFTHTLSPSPINAKGIVYNSPIKYLIVADPMFKEELQRFILWKKRKGYLVEEAYTDDPAVGKTNSSIKRYIQEQYNSATESNPAPTYVLLVGDVEQIPAFEGKEGKHPTDLYYCEWTGDYLPDCFYGRFSAQTVAQLIPQIDKTLAYEQCNLEDLGYLDHAVLVAGIDNTYGASHADGQVNYLHEQYVNNANGYVRVHKFLQDSNSDEKAIRNLVGEGSGLVYYTAHCGNYGWRNPRFDTTHVADMNNYGKYGFMLANCCMSGQYSIESCFAEAMMRAVNKGAVSYIGASNDTYWSEDYYWSVGFRAEVTSRPEYESLYLGACDKLFHTHGEPYSSWCTTNGAMVAAGNLSVEQSASTKNKYYWEVYHLFGDPSLTIWLSQPEEIILQAPDTILQGTSMLQVKTSPYATVTLTQDLKWLATATADAVGLARLRFPILTTPGKYELSASAQHYKTAFKTLVMPPYEPFHVLATDLQLSQESIPAVSQAVSWHVSISNMGQHPVDSICLKLQSCLPEVIVTDSVVWIEHLDLHDTLLTNAFSAILPDSLEDEYIAEFTVAAIYGQRIDTSRFFLKVQAPDWLQEDYWYEEIEGDGDGYMEAGELVRLSIVTRNTGHVSVDSILAKLTTESKQTSIIYSTDTLSDDSGTGYFMSQFVFRINKAISAFTIIPFVHHIISRHGHYKDTLYLMTGCTIEDFERGDFEQFDWRHNHLPWEVTDSCSFDGKFSARSAREMKHGDISSLHITLNVLKDDSISYYRKVSSEKGFDCFVFKINAAEMDRASGELPWQRISVPIKQGSHVLTFSYHKDYSGCEGEDAAWLDNIILPPHSNITSTVKIENQGHIVLYPNPASDVVTLETSVPILSLEIFDLSGKCIKKISNIASSIYQVNIQDLDSGMYIFRIHDINKSPFVGKLIKH